MVSETLLVKLQGILHERSLSPGQELLREDAVSATVYVVRSGELAVTVNTGQELGRCGPGTVVGELGFLDRGPASATVTSVSDTTVSGIERSELDAFARNHPDVASELLRALCTQVSSRIRRCSDRLDVLAQRPAEAPAQRSLFETLRALLVGER